MDAGVSIEVWRRYAMAVVILAWAFTGCGRRIDRASYVSPNGDCTVTIREYFPTMILLEPNVEVEVACRGRGFARYRGTYDWMYKSSAVRWDSVSPIVKVVACSHIAPALYAEFSLSPVALRRVNPEGLKARGRAKDGTVLLERPFRDGSDLLLKVTCYPEARW